MSVVLVQTIRRQSMTSSEFVQELRNKVSAFCATLDERPARLQLRSSQDRRGAASGHEEPAVERAPGRGPLRRLAQDHPGDRGQDHDGAFRRRGNGARRPSVGAYPELGADPFDYRPLPAQMSMFNAMEGLRDSCQRLAGFSMGGEGVANYLIEKCLAAPSVPDWIKALVQNASWPTKRVTAAVPRRSWSATPPPRSARRHPPGRGHAPGADAGSTLAAWIDGP